MMNRSPAETALSKAMIRWSLSKATLLAETDTSWIYRVDQNGRSPAVLKQLKPDADESEARGAGLMAWYGGEGAATVFDATDGIIFMEWLDGDTLGAPARAGRDEEATIALAHVVSELHRPRALPMPEDLLPVRARFEALFGSRPGAWPAMSKDLLARALGIAHRLFDKPAPQIPLHGDLHHDTILSSPRGWLAIDPIGLVGDPVYELAPVFLNPAGDTKRVTDPARVNALADILSSRLGHSRKRILAFAAAHTALTACWDVAAGRPITLQLTMLPNLLAAHDLA
ncbi:hypothetical protein EMQ25_10315 [Arsenicitalea aurantiaca]|uniref:Uncharacterized protein n=1 Tax=Arsenicitalea aurantiaca TaxID=1783274 RepID=A0A433XAY9_9HYPH|nr:aminoglycoside phosphotransferase family protein [Arsenicitalea aurantiaca]RUT31246.1 hypothetical protein EMQ25_10315 [Arsenicitalea aurantiaca]